MKDYYEILGIAHNATESQVQSAYRTAMRRFLAGRTHTNDDKALIQDLNEAFEVLSNANKREAYDTGLLQEDEEVVSQETPLEGENDPLSEEAAAAVYEEGYVAGYMAAKAELQAQQKAETGAPGAPVNASTDAKIATLKLENEALRRNIKTQVNARQEMEQKLQSQEHTLKSEAEYADELEMRLKWVKDATGTTETSNMENPLMTSAQRVTQMIRDIKQGIEEQKIELRTLAESVATVAQQERRKQIGEELRQILIEVEKRKKELDTIKEVEDKKRAFADLDRYFAGMERRAADWSKKIVADKKLAKPTLYDALGILIWATDQEVDEAYEKLMQQYADQMDNPACADFLQKVRSAYAVLGVPAKRREYNQRLGISEQRIENERHLADENNRLQAQYRQRLTEKKFWAKFDDLSSLALMGNPQAQNALGEIYFKGAHVRRDYKYAVYWFYEAFEQHYPLAIRNLGICYQNGLGVGKNEDVAAKLFRQCELRGIKAPKSKKE